MICGGRDCGEALVAHPRVAKVALIGSVPTGKAILKGAAETMKKVTLELGGKNALIAYPDADPAEVAAAAVRGMNFTWCGQSCGSTSRAFLKHLRPRSREDRRSSERDQAGTADR